MTVFSRVLARRMHLIEPRTTDVVHKRDLVAAMDDGVTLLADRWVARDTVGVAQPTVLVRSPYGRRQFPGLLFGRLFAERGFQVVVQSVRGTFGSGGAFAPFDERADGAATLRWLRAQPWHTGRVATMGPSYLGLVQWALAADAGDELAAMAIQVSASEFHGQTYDGGSVSLQTVASWLVVLATQERRLAPIVVNRALRALDGRFDEQPLIGLDELATGAPVAWLREGFAHHDREAAYWARRDFSHSVAQVSAPVSFVGGWHDILLPWMLEDFQALQAAGRSPRLRIGPWTHTSPELSAVGHRDAIAFLRARLLDDDRLLMAEGRTLPVRLRLTGAGAVRRNFETWPPADAVATSWFLRPGRELGLEPPTGAEPTGAEPTRAEPTGAEDRYRYDPSDPTPAFGGPVLLSRDAVLDNAPLEARADVLTFTTDPLPEVLEVIGRPTVEIWARASAPHFDIFARICDVDVDGVSRNVCDALHAVTPPGVADGHDDSETAGGVRVAFALWPLGHRFAAGHRLRLQISSGAHPRYARNPGTGEHPASAAPTAMRAVEITILRSAEHPSRVTLPVMRSRTGGDEVPAVRYGSRAG